MTGNALDEARHAYQAEIADVRDLRYNITAALEKLRLETEKLQLEEQTLRSHEERLNSSFQQLREKEDNYKTTGSFFVVLSPVMYADRLASSVAAVLEETKRVVIAADKKRDELLS